MDQREKMGINTSEPIENQETAAWATIKEVKPVSRVPIPTEEGVEDAKGWVDYNKK